MAENDKTLEIRPMELVKKFQRATEEMSVSVQDSFLQTLLEQVLERSHLNEASSKKFVKKDGHVNNVQWMQLDRLPIHPNDSGNYDLISRWQTVLSSLHIWNYRLYFLLLRNEGTTKIFFGTTSSQQGISNGEALEQIREAAFGAMPGIGLDILKEQSIALDEVYIPLGNMKAIGSVTGIPSFRDEDKDKTLQTLDPLAFGLRDANGVEKNYSLLVIADPISDKDISDIISSYRYLGSEIHTSVKRTVSESRSKGSNSGITFSISTGTGTSIKDNTDLIRAKKEQERYKREKEEASSMGSLVGTLFGALVGKPFVGGRIGKDLVTIFDDSEMDEEGYGPKKEVTENSHTDYSRQTNQGESQSISFSMGTEYLDKFAEYAEQVTQHHIDRLNKGRNLGFWNTGVYVLANTPQDVKTVTGMLRSIYSGSQTYFEPIRLHMFRDCNALSIVRDRFELLPMVDSAFAIRHKNYDQKAIPWHMLGDCFQYVSTPINTQELSLVTSLPRRDVPGLRFVKTAVRFANNPAKVDKGKISLGHIVDTGIVQNTTYDIDVNSFVRHMLVTGITGGGKSTTCKIVVTNVMRKDIPVLIIEPAKDDYVRWAIEQNKRLPKEKQFSIYMPGVQEFEGETIEPLKINPFEPAAVPGTKVDLLQRSEKFITLLNACLPSEEVVPILIEETVYETIEDYVKRQNCRLDGGLVEPFDSYPNVRAMQLTASDIMAHKSYAQINKDNLKEVLITRFKYLMRGNRGKILNVYKSTDYHKLFSQNAVINLSRLSGSKDKSLIMSLLMQALYEYRVSCYCGDPHYRERAQRNELLHLTLVEEAHNVLLKPSDNERSGSPQRMAAELFGNMLSEVRGYGQGLLVVDQVPTRLIDDVVKNTNYKIVHRLTAKDDQELMASCMAFREDQKYIIPMLEMGNAIICGDEDDAAAWVKIPKKIEDLTEEE